MTTRSSAASRVVAMERKPNHSRMSDDRQHPLVHSDNHLYVDMERLFMITQPKLSPPLSATATGRSGLDADELHP